MPSPFTTWRVSAGVSPMTVSRVMNGNSNVREATREHVMRAVSELNYTPNPAARSLAAAQGTRIGLIYTNPSAAYLSELLVGALDGASRTAHSWCSTPGRTSDPPTERAAARKLASSVAGVILPPPLCESKAIAAEFVAAGVPVVAVASGRFQADVSCVRIDDFRAAQEMTAHLHRTRPHAHRLHQGPSRIRPPAAAAYEGFQAAMQEAGISVDPGPGASGLLHLSLRAREPPKNCSARKRRPTAIFASNDDMAAAAVSVAHRRGLDVPRDLSVVGFDDTPTATTVWPELTTIRQPIAAMGESSIDLLLRSIRRKEGETQVGRRSRGGTPADQARFRGTAAEGLKSGALHVARYRPPFARAHLTVRPHASHPLNSDSGIITLAA